MLHARRLALVAAIVLALVPSAACHGARAAVRATPDAAAEAEVRAAMLAWLDALDALDVARMADGFAPDVAAFVPSVRAEAVTGRAEVARVFEAWAARMRESRPASRPASRMRTTPEALRVQASGTLGVASFQVRGEPASATRRRTFVFRRDDGRWLITHFHASDVAPTVAAP